VPLTLERAPSGVESKLWSTGVPGVPTVGDLWLLSWDGVALELAVISAVAPTFVLVWPVSLPDAPSFPPAVVVAETPLGVPLHLWPTRETGIGLHLLHRRFGSVLTARTMRLVSDELDVGKSSLLSLAAPNVEAEAIEAESDALVERWEAICFHTWPARQIGITSLDPRVLGQAGLEVGDLADVLGIALPEAVSIARGETAPTAEHLSVLAARLGVDPEQLLQDELDVAARLLLAPSVKDNILTIARGHGTDEAGARNLIRSEFALAARSDGDPQARLAAAIHRLHAEDGA
jgi:hypothetical protein